MADSETLEGESGRVPIEPRLRRPLMFLPREIEPVADMGTDGTSIEMDGTDAWPWP